ncbi:MAG: hypothetical protein ACRYFK_11360 [Janthinobacterium lividum]
MRLAYVACLVVAAACQPATTSDKIAVEVPTGHLAALHGTWLLLPEISHADTLTYRRNTYHLRYLPAGRPGFWLGPAGRFTRYDLAPGGGLQAQEGTWVEVSRGRLRIHLPEAEPAEPDYTLELLDYHQGVLQLLCRQ